MAEGGQVRAKVTTGPAPVDPRRREKMACTRIFKLQLSKEENFEI